MFVATMATVALIVVSAGLLVEALCRGGVPVPSILDPDGPSLPTRLWDLRTERPRFVLSAIGVAFILAVYPLIDAWMRAEGLAPPFGYWDFGAYTSALNRVLNGEPMYVTNDQGGYFGRYLYPPFFVLFVWPFWEVFPFDQAARLWQVTTVLFLWLTLQPVIGQLGHRLRLWERGILLWLLVGFHPLLFSVKQGQISAFLAGLLSISLYGLLRGRDGGHTRWARYLSGAATALVGTTKIVYGAVGTHLLSNRDRFTAALVAGFGVVVISLVTFGIDAHLGYLDVLMWGKGGDPSPPWLWMRTYYHPLYLLTPISLPIRLLLSLGLAVLAVRAVSADLDAEVYAMGVGAMPIIAPTAYTYYLTALLPAAILLIATENARDGHPVIPVLGVLLLHIHSYALKLVVDIVFQYMPHAHADVPLLFGDLGSLIAILLQPGVWGAILISGIAGLRVAADTDLSLPGIRHI